MAGIGDELKGRAKEALGDLTGDKKLKRAGKADQATGKVKGKIDQAATAVKKKADDVKAKMK